jgi:hypothetical protein
MEHVKAFVAGLLATLIFHQGAVAIFHAAGVLPTRAWNMAPTDPFGIPQVISLAFWGGVWGIILWLLVRPVRGIRRWSVALAIGAIAPTGVALLIVFPLKGMAVTLAVVAFGLVLNGVWGLGTLAIQHGLVRMSP